MRDRPPMLVPGVLLKELSGEVVSNDEIRASGSLIQEEEEETTNFRY